jgi:5-oxoprolinase (ATP-hydrolysing)
MRYEGKNNFYIGTDFTIMTTKDEYNDYRNNFEKLYERQYGFIIKERNVIVDDIRIRGIGKNEIFKKSEISQNKKEINPIKITKTYFNNEGWKEIPVYDLNDCYYGLKIDGPSIIMQSGSTILLTPDCYAEFSIEGNVLISLNKISKKNNNTELDSVKLSIFSHRFMSIAGLIYN